MKLDSILSGIGLKLIYEPSCLIERVFVPKAVVVKTSFIGYGIFRILRDFVIMYQLIRGKKRKVKVFSVVRNTSVTSTDSTD